VTTTNITEERREGRYMPCRINDLRSLLTDALRECSSTALRERIAKELNHIS
jgi:hypothetical protein